MSAVVIPFPGCQAPRSIAADHVIIRDRPAPAGREYLVERWNGHDGAGAHVVWQGSAYPDAVRTAVGLAKSRAFLIDNTERARRRRW